MRFSTLLITIVLLGVLVMPLGAQDGPPADSQAMCIRQPALYEYFGPNCLNPVTWNLPGFRLIDTWVHFVREDGTTDAGLIVGYSWQRFEGRYFYYLMTAMPFEGFGGVFEVIAPEAIIQ